MVKIDIWIIPFRKKHKTCEIKIELKKTTL